MTSAEPPKQGRCGCYKRRAAETRAVRLLQAESPDAPAQCQLQAQNPGCKAIEYTQNKFCCYRENVLKYVGNTPNTSAKAMTNTSSPDTRAMRQTPAHKPRYKGDAAKTSA
jgi:hypothetical protein